MRDCRSSWQSFASHDSISARALEFTVLTAARTGEAIGATWDEIDAKAKVWTVPAQRMKASKPHRVPLSERVIDILKTLPRDDSGFLFIGGRAGKHLSNWAMLELLKGMNANGYTPHGFRSTFSDWARDRAAFPRDIIEMALAHTIKDKSEAAYRRGDALEKRGRLMTEWSRYCSSPLVKTGSNVRSLHGTGAA
jgi:integrase